VESIVHRRIRHGILTSAAATCALLLAMNTMALAHVDPDPIAVQAGTAVSVAFKVEHGCNDSPTVKLEFKVPDTVTDAQPVAKAGWTGSVTDGIVMFSDGSLAADIEDTFSISFTAPATAGIIHFPIAQTCATGSIAWVEIAADGAPEPEHPAATINVTAGPPTAEELTPVANEEHTADTMDMGTGTGTGTGSTMADGTTMSDDTGTSDRGSGNTGAIVAVGVGVAAVVIGGSFVLIRKRRTPSQP
jgi:periplasmic copper chaperone A